MEETPPAPPEPTSPQSVQPDALPTKTPEPSIEGITATTDAETLSQAPPEQDIPDTVAKQTPTAQTSKAKRFSIKKLSKKQLILLAIIIVALAGSAAAFLVLNKKEPTNNTITTDLPTAEEQPVDTSNTELDYAPAQDVTMLSGNTYLTAPKKLGDLKFYKSLDGFGGTDCDNQGNNCKPLYTAADLNYYQLGTTKKGEKIVIAYAKSKTIDGDIADIAIETSANQYSLLAQPAVNYDNKKVTSLPLSITDALNSNVTIDLTTVFAEFVFPADVTVSGQKLKATQYGNPQFMPNGLKSLCTGSYCSEPKADQPIEKIADASGLTFYRTIYKAEPNYKIVELNAVLAGMFSVRYKLYGELSSTTEKLAITWTTGESEAISAYSGGAGCGSVGYVATSITDKTTLKQIGTSKTGQKVYQLPNDHALTKELYEQDYNKGEGATEDSLKNLTLQQFLEKHAYFITENGFGEYVVFQRSDVFLRGGCGKPVVYLYPTITTSINVRVGADVVISEPFYEKNGWQNVTAQPNGQLTYKSKQYDSLYWEGYGHGPYPDVTEGTIVESADAASVIKQQLKAQGLNDKETTDFMEFWEPKLPKTAYTRLTWFGTGALNRLAPLSISPAPQTVIRTFLDFEGLDTMQILKPQTFSKPARQGFTVVEWGGLLREGIKQ